MTDPAGLLLLLPDAPMLSEQLPTCSHLGESRSMPARGFERVFPGELRGRADHQF